MEAFDELHDGERALHVRQPVEIDPEDRRGHVTEMRFDVEAGVAQHPIGEIDDLDVVIIALEEGRDARQTDRVHLEHRRRGDGVGDRAEEGVCGAEVVDGRRVKQDEVARERIPHRRLLGSSRSGRRCGSRLSRGALL